MMPDAPVTIVTGGAGFIGSAVCRRLSADGQRVVGYDNLSRGRREHLSSPATLVEGDIRDERRWKETLAAVRPSTVVHLAAMHYIPDCVARPAEALDVNVEGTRTILDGCLGSSVRRVIFASTGAVYAPSDLPCVENQTPIGPLEVYGQSKRLGEQLVETFCRETGVSVAVLRLFNAVGPYETNPHVIPHIFESLRTSDSISLGNVAPRRDYVDTRDVAAAIATVLGAPLGFHCLNVGTGVAHSVSDVVSILQRLLDRPIVINRQAARARANERMVLVADIAAIRRLTGWAPALQLEDSLRELVQAYGLRIGTSKAG
jgi:UDP-glucose 4-epimerase